MKQRTNPDDVQVQTNKQIQGCSSKYFQLMSFLQNRPNIPIQTNYINFTYFGRGSALEKMNQDGQMAFESMRGREWKLIRVIWHTNVYNIHYPEKRQACTSVPSGSTGPTLSARGWEGLSKRNNFLCTSFLLCPVTKMRPGPRELPFFLF